MTLLNTALYVYMLMRIENIRGKSYQPQNSGYVQENKEEREQSTGSSGAL